MKKWTTDDGLIPKDERIYRKMVGILQIAATHPLRLGVIDDKLEIHHLDKLIGVMPVEEFLESTPKEILDKLGVKRK